MVTHEKQGSISATQTLKMIGLVIWAHVGKPQLVSVRASPGIESGEIWAKREGLGNEREMRKCKQ